MAICCALNWLTSLVIFANLAALDVIANIWRRFSNDLGRFLDGYKFKIF